MTKTKTEFVCQQCNSKQSRWLGQCPDCLQWNTFAEQTVSSSKFAANQQRRGYAGETARQICNLAEIPEQSIARLSSSFSELDRVLGGGIAKGSVILVGGDPGIGKSTIILQTISFLSNLQAVLYVTGEESLSQVSMRAKRLELDVTQVKILAETNVETILDLALETKPNVMVIDSIQTLFTDTISSAPGSVSQIRETASRLVQYAKQTHTTIFLIGHVTKEGQLAGPRVLEHMVDTVLYFEGDMSQRYRMIRAIKNRFGAVNELGIFAMTDKGLREVNNPSAIFLSNHHKDVPGSVIMVSWEGTRPILVEVQALVDQSYGNMPKRICVGVEQQRLVMLLAVLNRHAQIATFDQDVFVNVVGGIHVSETAADLAVICAIASSLKNKALSSNVVIFGEIGLSGEIRPVMNGQERLKEAQKHGFAKAIIPKANHPKKNISDIEIIAVDTLQEALQYGFRQ